jgi:L-asparagine transporter-like permease
MFGVGATIGTGIFIILTEAVPEAGPGVIVSFGTYLLDIVLDVSQLD